MKNLRKNLVFLRKRSNLSRNKVDDYLKRKAGAIKRYEEGTSEPNISTVAQLAELFNVSLDDLVNSDLSKKSSNKVVSSVTDSSSQPSDKLDRLYSLLESTINLNVKLLEKLETADLKR